MRILRVAQKIYPEVKGGGPYHVHAVSRDQAAMGHDVTVLTVRRRADAPDQEERNGYTVICQDPTTSLLGNEISVGLARKLWSAEDFDVVHAHSHLYFATNVAALRRRFGETPLAMTNHGLYSQSAPQWLFDWYLKTLGRWTFNRADVVFTYTESERDVLRERGVRTGIEVVRNGIDIDRFAPDGPASDAIDGDGPTVLFVGRLVDGKRPQDAVRAVERLAAEYPSITLLVVGDGPLRDDLESRVAAAGLEENVRFLGHIAYDAMPPLYRSADVLVLPSESEGFPRTVMESLATGTPVVTSDLNQLQAITSVAGASVPVGDVDGFAAAIEEVLAEGGAGRGERGRELVRENHAWERTVRETTAALADLVAGRPSTPAEDVP
jgi:glycosyltransferase involved in cell wall biosynthesis